MRILRLKKIHHVEEWWIAWRFYPTQQRIDHHDMLWVITTSMGSFVCYKHLLAIYCEILLASIMNDVHGNMYILNPMPNATESPIVRCQCKNNNTTRHVFVTNLREILDETKLYCVYTNMIRMKKCRIWDMKATINTSCTHAHV